MPFTLHAKNVVDNRTFCLYQDEMLLIFGCLLSLVCKILLPFKFFLLVCYSQIGKVWTAHNIKEFNHTSTNMIISFLLFCKISCHKSLTPSKSKPQKSKHDFKEKFHYVRVGTIEPMHTKDIMTIKPVFLPYESVLEYE